jgi:hypothetical protein
MLVTIFCAPNRLTATRTTLAIGTTVLIGRIRTTTGAWVCQIEGRDNWDIFRPILGNPALAARPSDISFTAAYFRELLQVRKSSPLFRLQTAEEVTASLGYLNTGPLQTPGLIVMTLTDYAGVDPNYHELLVVINARPDGLTFGDESLVGKEFRLHPILQNSVDERVRAATFNATTGSFSIAGRTSAVFVRDTGDVPPVTVQRKANTDPLAADLGTLLVRMLAVFAGLGALTYYFWRKKQQAAA